jgi:hypothetical protein
VFGFDKSSSLSPYQRLKINDFIWPCSGCVTSAETVMLEKQSLDEFLANVNKGKVVIVSLSPQSRASIAVHFGISPLQVKLKHCKLYFYLSFSSFPVTRPWMRTINLQSG